MTDVIHIAMNERFYTDVGDTGILDVLGLYAATTRYVNKIVYVVTASDVCTKRKLCGKKTSIGCSETLLFFRNVNYKCSRDNIGRYRS